MKKFSTVIFTIALLAMVFAPAAFADKSDFIANDGTKVYAIKVSDDGSILSKDVTTSADKLKAGNFFTLGKKVYLAEEGKLTPVSGDLSADTAKAITLEGSGAINAVAKFGENFVVLGAEKGFVLTSELAPAEISALSSGASSADLAGNFAAEVTSGDDKFLAIVKTDENSKVSLLSKDFTFINASKDFEGTEVFGVKAVAGHSSFDVFSGLGISLDIVSYDNTNKAYTLSSDTTVNSTKVLSVAEVGETFYMLVDGGKLRTYTDKDTSKDIGTIEGATTIASVGAKYLAVFKEGTVIKLVGTDKSCDIAADAGLKAIVELATDVEFTATTTSSDTKSGDTTSGDTTVTVTAGTSSTEDFSSLSESVQTSITSALSNAGVTVTADDFLTSKDITSTDISELETTSKDLYKTLTSSDALVEKISTDLAATQFDSSTVTTFGIIKPSRSGYVLQKAAVPSGKTFNLAKLVFYFIRLAALNSSTTTEALLAADENAVEAVLLNAETGAALGNSGTLAAGTEFYAVPSNPLGTEEYVMVAGEEATASETDQDKDKDDGTTTVGSSGGGCEMGFGLWSLAALMAYATLSKRR